MKATEFKTVKTWLTPQNILSAIWQILFFFALIPAVTARTLTMTVHIAPRDVFMPILNLGAGARVMAVFLILLPILSFLLVNAFRFIKMDDKIKGFIVGGGVAFFALLEFIFALIFSGCAAKAIGGGAMRVTFWFVLGLLLDLTAMGAGVLVLLGMFKLNDDIFTQIKGGLKIGIAAPKKPAPAAAPAPEAAPAPAAETAPAEPAAEDEKAAAQAFCPNCGAPVTPGSAFCMNCGTKLN